MHNRTNSYIICKHSILTLDFGSVIRAPVWDSTYHEIPHVCHLTPDCVEVFLGSADVRTIQRHDVVRLNAAEQILHQPLQQQQTYTIQYLC